VRQTELQDWLFRALLPFTDIHNAGGSVSRQALVSTQNSRIEHPRANEGVSTAAALQDSTSSHNPRMRLGPRDRQVCWRPA